jgi:hypothetical protein
MNKSFFFRFFFHFLIWSKEVDQTRRPEKFNPKRVIFPTSIVTNANQNSIHQRNSKVQGRPIPSVFLTQDPVKYSL